MGLIELVSGNSVWRGINYYNNKNVILLEKIGSGECDGIVARNCVAPYSVHIDKAHPRKSTCNCPFEDGRRVNCKHMIALLFIAEPKAAEDFLKR